MDINSDNQLIYTLSRKQITIWHSGRYLKKVLKLLSTKIPIFLLVSFDYNLLASNDIHHKYMEYTAMLAYPERTALIVGISDGSTQVLDVKNVFDFSIEKSLIKQKDNVRSLYIGSSLFCGSHDGIIQKYSLSPISRYAHQIVN
jgi:hypothetical protein